MGYYSEIAAAMQRSDYEEMLKSINGHPYKKELEDFIQAADKTVSGNMAATDSIDVAKGISPDDIIVLHWQDYKHWHVAEDEFLNDWCDRHDGDYVRVGEEIGDVVSINHLGELNVGETTIDWQVGDTRYNMRDVLEKIARQCGGAKAMADRYGIPEEKLKWLQMQEQYRAKNERQSMSLAVISPGKLAAEINSLSNSADEKLRIVENIKTSGCAVLGNDINDVTKNR